MTDPAISLRTAAAADAPALVEAFNWLFAPPGAQPADWDHEAARPRIEAVVAAANSDVLVAARGDEIVGFCSVALDLASIRFGQRAWVEDLAVHPDLRSAGIGKALLDAAKDWGRQRGAAHLELDSGDSRADAHRFY